MVLIIDNSKPRMHTVIRDFGIDTEMIHLVPLSDLHIGSPQFDESLFLKYREWILDSKDTYCVLNGDIMEMATKSSVGSVFEGLRPREQRKLVVKYLRPLAEQGKILAYVDGNHEARAKKESDEYLGEEVCSELGIPSAYAEDAALLFLTVGYDRSEGRKTRNVYVIYMLHGWTGARRVGGKMNNLEDLQRIAVADIFVSSHVHQIGAFPKKIMIPDSSRKRVRWKKQLFVSTGAFLEYEGYAVAKGYPPSAMGSPCITLLGMYRDFNVRV